VAGLLLYLLVVERVLTSITALNRWTSYLPGQAQEALVGSTLTNQQLLQPWQGGLVLAAHGLALALVCDVAHAVPVTSRHSVSMRKPPAGVRNPAKAALTGVTDGLLTEGTAGSITRDTTPPLCPSRAPAVPLWYPSRAPAVPCRGHTKHGNTPDLAIRMRLFSMNSSWKPRSCCRDGIGS
jgi:hypothetical protein